MVLDRYTAESIGVRIGDKVRVEAAEIEVTGLSDQYINRIQYVSAQQAKDLGEEASLCCYCKYSTLFRKLQNFSRL